MCIVLCKPEFIPLERIGLAPSKKGHGKIFPMRKRLLAFWRGEREQKSFQAPKTPFLSPLERFFLVAGLLFGSLLVLLLPVGGGYDEETHLMRVWEMSALVLVPNEKLGSEIPFPAVYWEMSYRRPFLVRPVPANFGPVYGSLKIGAHDFVYGTVETRSVYSPPLLLPQALVMRYLGRRLDWPALPVFYFLRFTGLFCYLALTWLALRLIPLGKGALTALALLPTALLQASTVSADAISNGLAFLFLGIVLRAAQRPVGRREFALLSLGFALLFLGKLNLVPLALLPFLLLRPAQFRWRQGFWALAALALVLLALEVGGWNALAYGRLATAAGRADPLGQIQFILAHPLQFLGILAQDVQRHGWGYLRNSLAIYGYNYWPVPGAVFWFSAAALLAATFAPSLPQTRSRRTALALLTVFVLSYAATIASLYVTFNPVGSPLIEGVQGRYFLTVWPLLLLGLAAWPGWPGKGQTEAWARVLQAGALMVYALGMALVYYLPCGAQYFQPGLCYQPNYKNWAPQEALSAPLQASTVLEQEILPECSALTEIRVWLDSSQAAETSLTRFEVLAPNQSPPLIDLATASRNLPAGGWYALRFSPQENSLGQRYLLRISTAQALPGPRIGLSLRPEYPAVKLFQNGQPQGQDLLFQTGCLAGWQRIFSTGKP